VNTQPVDAHYTPQWLATRLLGFLDRPLGASAVADFAAGDGELLRAAQQAPLTDARFIARDSDQAAIKRIRARHEDWDAEVLDLFLVGDQLRSEVGVVDRLVLNPPYSYRGAGGVPVSMPDLSGRFSPAMAFLLYSLLALSDGGQCLAIMPENVLHSEKDAPAMEFIRGWRSVSVLDVLPPRTFPGVHARSALIQIGVSSPGVPQPSGDVTPERCTVKPLSIEVDIVRGCVPVHTTSSLGRNTVDFLHSTGLRQGNVVTSRVSWPAPSGRSVDGPFVAIPRVGQITPSKVCVHRTSTRVLLSDCVIAIKTSDPSRVDTLHAELISAFGALRAEYRGSCAPYLTIARLRSFLQCLGFSVLH